MFQIIGAMAEFERALIQERVRAGLRNAKAKGKRIGRPRQVVDSLLVLKLRAEGLSWRAISNRLKLGLGTVYRAISSDPKPKTQSTMVKSEKNSEADTCDDLSNCRALRTRR